jgi:hypothetical protein
VAERLSELILSLGPVRAGEVPIIVAAVDDGGTVWWSVSERFGTQLSNGQARNLVTQFHDFLERILARNEG